MRIPYSEVVVSGNAVDNDQNNSDDLIRIGNKLYYNYAKSKYCYGLIEISEEGSKRIYWSGPRWLAEYAVLPGIFKKDGRLLAVIQDAVQSYSANTGTFVKDDFLDSIPGFRMDQDIDFRESKGKLFYRTDDLYKSTDYDSTLEHIWLYENGEHKLLAEGEGLSFYVKDNNLFYIESDIERKDRIIFLKKLDMNTGTTETLFDLSDFERCGRFAVEGNHIVISGWNGAYGVYKIAMTGEEKKSLPVCVEGRKTKDGAKIKEVGTFTVYNGYVYAATDKGVIQYDIDTNEEFTLCEKAAKRCYIVDDKWVYFSDEESTLYRVTQDGKKIEKVFG